MPQPNPLKTGFATSEWITTILGIVSASITGIISAQILPDESPILKGLMVSSIILGQVLAVLGYQWHRSRIKIEAVRAEATIKAAEAVEVTRRLFLKEDGTVRP